MSRLDPTPFDRDDDGDDDTDTPLGFGEHLFADMVRVAGTELLSPDAVVGDYTLVRHLGRGGYGYVWAAQARNPDRLVALKFPRAGCPPLSEEAQRLIRWSHPFIVPVIDCPTVGGITFLVLEYAAGGSLRDWHRHPAVTTHWTVERMLEVCDALSDVHQVGGDVHRDVKPGNILLFPVGNASRREATSSDGPVRCPPRLKAKLSDLDLVATGGSQVWGGTPGFAPAEQYVGNCDPTVDVFAVGATLYAMLVDPACHGPGPRPGTEYVRPNRAEFRQAEVDADLTDVIRKAIAPRPEDRYASVAALAHDLRQWLAGEPTSLHGVRGRMMRFAKKHPAKAALLALVPVATLAAGIALIYAADRTQLATQAQQDKLDTDRQAQWDQRLAVARSFATVGRWEVALPAYQLLIDDPLTTATTAVRLRAERLPGLLATHQIPAYTAELDALRAAPDIGPAAGQLRLYDAERAMWKVYQTDEDRRKLTKETRIPLADAVRNKLIQAIAALGPWPADPPAGWDADVQYARALTAAHPPALIAALREAAVAAPYHYPTRRALAVALAAQGRFQGYTTPWGQANEFRAEVDFVRTHFPESPVAEFADHLFQAMATPTVVPPAPRMRDRLDGESADRLDRVFFEVRSCVRIIGDMKAVRDGGFLAEVQKASDVYRGGEMLETTCHFLFQKFGLPYPTVAPLANTLMAFEAYTDALNDEQTAEEVRSTVGRIDTAHRQTPERLFALAAIFVRMKLFCRLIQNDEWDEHQEPAKVLRDLFDQMDAANTAPSVAPTSPLAYRILPAGVVAGGILLRVSRAPERADWDKTRVAVDRLVADGRRFKAVRPGVIRTMLTALRDGGRQLDADAWPPSPGSDRAFRDRKLAIVDLISRPLLNDWALDEPDNPEPLLQLAENEWWAGANPITVMATLWRAIQRKPDAATWRRILELKKATTVAEE